MMATIGSRSSRPRRRAGPQVTTLTYDDHSDRRATATVGGASTVWTYETSTGRLDTRTDTVDGLAFTVNYDYDTNDNLTKVTYPSGRQVGYQYDAEQRITRVFNAVTQATYADQFSYHPSGAVASYRSGNGVVTTLTYDADRHWLDSLFVNATDDLDLAYAYDDVGNIDGITDPRPGMSQLFQYDAADRLTQAAAGFYGTLTYTYDAPVTA